MYAVLENVIIFATTTYNKTHHITWHMVVTARLRAKFRHRTTRRLGGDRPQTK